MNLNFPLQISNDDVVELSELSVHKYVMGHSFFSLDIFVRYQCTK